MFSQLFKRIKLFSRKREKFFILIKTMTGISPKNLSLYQLAFLHKSVQYKDSNGSFLCNERMEFLGDAILGAVIAHELYRLFPDEDEGVLTKMRSRIVNRTLLNQVGLQMNLDQIIKIQTQVNLAQTHILGDAVEALIGAFFLDHGYYKTRIFILEKIITPHFNIFEIALKDSNYKSLLIEWGQRKKLNVVFLIDQLEAEGHLSNVFKACVKINGEIFGEGLGNSKKEAQQNAARIAYKKVVAD